MSEKNQRKACIIAKKSLDYGLTLVEEGVFLFDIAKKIEEKIKKLGAKPAFPVNISLNSLAAHYTPLIGDKTKVTNKDLVKLDVGVHINGFIGDNARSVGSNKELIKASKKALDAAIKVCKHGVKVSDIGRTIESEITSLGFKPVKNLTGHGFGQFKQHSGVTIPNYDNGDKTTLNSGDIIAIEPFATNGLGLVKDSTPSGIYQIINPKPIRTGREVMTYILDNFKTLPFVSRWLNQRFPSYKVRFVLNSLEKQEILHQYPRLIEQADGLVSQSEDTVLIKDSKAEILTKLD